MDNPGNSDWGISSASTTDHLTINAHGSIEELILYDTFGRFVQFDHQDLNGELLIDISTYSIGVYYIQLNGTVKKFCKTIN